MASGFPTTHLKATSPPTAPRAPHLSVCCCHLLSTRVKSLMRGQAQRETLFFFLVDENSFGRETDGAGGEGSREIFFPPSWY